MELDHLAILCADLEEGAAWAEARLGVPLQPGGQHTHYGTHNRLLGLGPGLYLEVIAPDPAVPDPGRPRWFGLDTAGAPRLGNWIVRTDTMQAQPPGAGEVVALSRGDLAWEITVPADGSLCEGGAFPSLIRWGPGLHPSTRLADHGVRLAALRVSHPSPTRISAMLRTLTDPRVTVAAARRFSLSAEFDTPAGRVML